MVQRIFTIFLIQIIFFSSGCSRPVATEQTSLSDYPPLPDNLTRARVVRVVDGDTIIVQIGRDEERVRLIGFNPLAGILVF